MAKRLIETPKGIEFAPVGSEEKWLITWRPNSEYVAQSQHLKLPADHVETFIQYGGDPEEWVKANPHKAVVFCCKLA